MDPPDLTGAKIYVETQDPPVAGGRWYVLVNDTVLYQRSDGGFNATAIVPAHTLRTSSSWRAISAVESDN